MLEQQQQLISAISTSRLRRGCALQEDNLAPRLESKQRAQRWHVFTPSLIYALSSAEPWLTLLFLFLPSFLPDFPPPFHFHFIHFSAYWYSSLCSYFPPSPSLHLAFLSTFSVLEVSLGLKMLLTLVTTPQTER